MKCDTCDKEATVHDTVLRDGAWVEVHCCEACAAKQGLAGPGPTLNELLTNFVLPQVTGEKPRQKAVRAKSPTCTNCGFSFEQFRQAGLLGCPQCYVAFESLLLPLLERAHEGSAQHIGKIPRRLVESGTATAELESARQLAAKREQLERERVLRRQLEDAVRSEQYELAAKIRDQLQHLIQSSGAPRPG